MTGLQLCSCLSQKHPVLKYKQLPMLLIENEGLIPLFDKSVSFIDTIEEKPDSLFFTINTHKRSKQDYYTLQISSKEHRITIFNGYEDPIGYFYYKNHLFIVYNQESEQFFSETNNKKSFCYDPKIKDKLLVIDDSLPYWDYLYYNDKFILCGESIPFRFRIGTDKE
jgi:hypothetical protein